MEGRRGWVFGSWHLLGLAGIQEAASKHNDSGKLSLHVRADESGIVSLEKAEAAFEVEEEYIVKVPFENSTSEVQADVLPAAEVRFRLDRSVSPESLCWPLSG